MDPLVYYEHYWNQDEPPPESDPTTPERERLLLSTLQRIQHSGDRLLRVLDAGCGNGWFINRLLGNGYEAHGVEASRMAVQQALRLCPGTSIQVASLEEQLPYPDDFFDAVWCTEVIEHLFDIPKFLTEMRRVLRTDGLIILTTPYHGFVKNLAIVLAGFDKHFDPMKSHIRFFSVASLDNALKESGFVRLWWKGIGRFWPLYMSMFVVARKQIQLPTNGKRISQKV